MPNTAQFDPTLNLYQADGHTSLKVLSIQGGWRTRRCFNQMGIHAGDRVRILRKAPFGGPLVIENRGTQVAVSKQLAEKIKVEVLP
jgi:Fe2+ transport system protein FeoA